MQGSSSAPVYRLSKSASSLHLGELHKSIHGTLGSGPNALHSFCASNLRQRIPNTASRTSFREWCLEHVSSSMQEHALFELQLRQRADVDNRSALDQQRVRLRQQTLQEERDRESDARRRQDIVRKFTPLATGPRHGSPGREGGRVAPQ